MGKDEDREKQLQRFLELDNRQEESIMDSINGHFYREGSMMECKWPAIVKKHGDAAGRVFIHFSRCRKCKFAVTFPHFGGIRCGYGDKK